MGGISPPGILTGGVKTPPVPPLDETLHRDQVCGGLLHPLEQFFYGYCVSVRHTTKSLILDTIEYHVLFGTLALTCHVTCNGKKVLVK